MKLRNKQTGEIGNLNAAWLLDTLTVETPQADMPNKIVHYNSLAELNTEWEDYEELKDDIWWLDNEGNINHVSREFDNNFAKNREIGNYFKTREEAEKAVEKLKAWKRLKDKGFRFNGYEHMMSSGHKQRVYVDWFIPLDYEKYIPDLDLLFGGEE